MQGAKPCIVDTAFGRMKKTLKSKERGQAIKSGVALTLATALHDASASSMLPCFLLRMIIQAFHCGGRREHFAL